jgi:hypothetical protein
MNGSARQLRVRDDLVERHACGRERERFENPDIAFECPSSPFLDDRHLQGALALPLIAVATGC